MANSKISVENLNLHYGENHALKDVNMEIADHAITAFIGPSGCGKSTILSLIAGLLTPGSGGITFYGENGHQPGIGYMLQHDLLFEWRNVWQNVTLGLEIAHKDTARNLERVRRMLSDYGLLEFQHKKPSQLSGGMRQRVMIAMALCCNPGLLIADEPTTALDVTIQAQIMALLRNLQKESGMSMILITHDIGLVASMADRVIVMYAGQMIEEAPVKELFAAPAHPYTKALLQTVPGIYDEKDRELVAIPGMVPENYDSIPGCRVADRCAFRTKGCDQPQSYRQIGEGHFVRCMLAKEGET